MNYYYYISDAKVDMLLAQIEDAKAKKITSEIGFDFKVISAKRITESAADNERIARLEVVTSFIRKYGNLGTVTEPDEYIEDTLPMVMVPIGVSPQVIYFTGQDDKTIVGMGGSMKHLIGAGVEASQLITAATSSLPTMILQALASEPEVQKEGVKGLLAIEVAAKSLGFYQPEERLRFMAKRLAVKDFDGRKLILGSPLYVIKED